jgi:hypothetical protein
MAVIKHDGGETTLEETNPIWETDEIKPSTIQYGHWEGDKFIDDRRFKRFVLEISAYKHGDPTKEIGLTFGSTNNVDEAETLLNAGKSLIPFASGFFHRMILVDRQMKLRWTVMGDDMHPTYFTPEKED